ncbi:hypothetical protein ACQR94_29410, partial [Klebsiella pneumoniae]
SKRDIQVAKAFKPLLLHQGEAVRLAERREHNAAGSQP